MDRERERERGYSGFHHCVEQQSCLHLQQLSIYKQSSIVHTSYLCVSINWGMVLSSVNIFGNKDSICRKSHLLGVSRHKPAQTSCHLGRLHVTETCYVCPAVFISAFAGRSFHPSWPYIREIGRRPLFLLRCSIVHCIVLTSEVKDFFMTQKSSRDNSHQ